MCRKSSKDIQSNNEKFCRHKTYAWKVWAGRNQRGKGTGAPQFFAKVDLLPTDNDSERKKSSIKNINQFEFFKNYW